MIALVISIIVMLILAGVSISAIVGEDGIISKATSAVYIQSAALLEEYFNELYAEGAMDKIEEGESPLATIIKNGYQNYFFATSDGICLKKPYTNPENGENLNLVLYLIKREQLPDEIKSQIAGEDNLDSRSYRKLKGVYGITSDLRVYYCKDGLESIMRLGLNDLNLDSPDVIAFDKDSVLAQIVNGGTEDLSNQSLKTIKELIIDSEEELKVLKDFSNLICLKKVTFFNVTIESLDGIEGASILNDVIFENCRCKDYSALAKVYQLNTLFLIKPIGKNDDVIDLCSEEKGIRNAKLSNLEYFGIIGDKSYIGGTDTLYASSMYGITDISSLSRLDNVTKQAIKYMYLPNNQINDISCLLEFINIEVLQLTRNPISTFNGIQNMCKLKYLIAQDCYSASTSSKTLGSLEGDTPAENDALNYLYFNNNKNNSLYYINLTNNSSIKYVSNLKKCEALEYCYLKGCSSIKDIFEIASVLEKDEIVYNLDYAISLQITDAKVKSINLNNQIISVADFEKLMNNSKMEDLGMAGLKIVDNYSSNQQLTNKTTPSFNSEVNKVLKTLPNLVNVELNACPHLETIEFVKSTPKLRTINLCGTLVKTNSGDITKNGLELLNTYCNDLSTLVLNGTPTKEDGSENINLSLIQPAINKMGNRYYTKLKEGSIKGMNDYDGVDKSKLWYANTPNAGIVMANTQLQASIGLCTDLEVLITYNSQRHGGLGGQMVDIHNCNKIEFLQSRGNSCGYILGPAVKSAMLDADGSRGFDCTYASSIEEIKITWGSCNTETFATLCESLENNRTLKILDVHACPIQDISPIIKLKDVPLKKFIASRNGYAGFSDISNLAYFTELEEVNIADQYVTDISALSGLTKLKKLNIQNNIVRDISPLNNTDNLEEFIAAGNYINDIYPLLNKNNLKTLDLSSNALTDIFYNNGKGYETLEILYELNTKGLTKLYIKDNNIDDLSLLEDTVWEDSNGF